MKHLLTAIFISLLVYSCGGGTDKVKIDDNSTDSPGSTLVRSAALANTEGSQCEEGGVRIDSGIDLNTNGKLDNNEIDVTKIVCNGTSGYNSLIKIEDETAGENCAASGKSINTGKDLNRNDILDTDEIDDTQYICNGLAGTDGEVGEKGTDGTSGSTSSSCSVADNGDGIKTLSCDDGTSVTISDGIDGVDGQDGTSNVIAASIFCSNNFSDWKNLNWIYSVKQFSSGDIFVRASIFGESFELSKSNMFSNQQVGHTEAPVVITYDVLGDQDYGSWKFKLDRSTLLTTIEYYDIFGLTTSPKVWIEPADKCIVNDYTP